jgi:hypothetical protein
MGHGPLDPSPVRSLVRGSSILYGIAILRETHEMKTMLRSQAFRIVMLLSALASSSLVLAAGQRWK